MGSEEEGELDAPERAFALNLILLVIQYRSFSQ